MARVFNWTKEHFLHCNLAAINHSFTNETVKEELRKKIRAAYKGV
jgi:hypothetical protein